MSYLRNVTPITASTDRQIPAIRADPQGGVSQGGVSFDAMHSKYIMHAENVF